MTMTLVRTLHIPQREALSSKAVRSAVDVYDRLLSQCNPYYPLRRRMRILDARDYLIDSLERRLTEGIDMACGHSSEVDRASDAVVDVVRFLEPLVGLQERPK